MLIFYPNGRTKNVAFNYIATLKLLLLAVVVFSCSVLGLTIYNYMKLNSLKNNYTMAMHNHSIEQADIIQRVKKLEDFEEKISFFLGGALTNRDNLRIVSPGGMGGGDESLMLEDDDLSLPEIPELDLNDIEELENTAEDVEQRVLHLHSRLDKLADLAVVEKAKLDFTPSIKPVQGYVSSTFGWRKSPFTGKRHLHRGLDFVNKIGTQIHCTAAGTVSFAGKMDYWGNCVFIKHINGIVTKYGHMKETEVHMGDIVQRGDVIGKVGMTGRTTGPHVHYQIEIDGQPVDPMQFILEEL